jgi:hypothetical protein
MHTASIHSRGILSLILEAHLNRFPAFSRRVLYYTDFFWGDAAAGTYIASSLIPG